MLPFVTMMKYPCLLFEHTLMVIHMDRTSASGYKPLQYNIIIK